MASHFLVTKFIKPGKYYDVKNCLIEERQILISANDLRLKSFKTFFSAKNNGQ